MPKGRGSNLARRNRRLKDRSPRGDIAAAEAAERGHKKLLALIDRAQSVQKKRRKKAKQALSQ